MNRLKIENLLGVEIAINVALSSALISQSFLASSISNSLIFSPNPGKVYTPSEQIMNFDCFWGTTILLKSNSGTGAPGVMALVNLRANCFSVLSGKLSLKSSSTSWARLWSLDLYRMSFPFKI